jgi:hypothetical protein
MPSYLVEVATEQGPERFPFTLDHDRALGPQVTQVLEELRQRGVVLKGKHDDELGIFWGGRELDRARPAGELGISAARPIELRMRERVEPESMLPEDRSLPRGVLASLVVGYCAGLAAWLATGLRTDLTPLVPTYLRLDQLTLLVLGAIVGALVLAAAAARRRGSVPLALFAGLVLGAVGALIGGSMVLVGPGATSLRGFVIARVIGWGLAAAFASLLLACYGNRVTPMRLLESFALGLFGGAVAGVIFALPGPSELWQAAAFAVLGAGVGVAACGPALWRASALADLVSARRPGILSVREWAVDEGRAAALGSASVACQQGMVALYPAPAGAALGERRITEPAFLPATAAVSVDGATYRVRQMQAGA